MAVDMIARAMAAHALQEEGEVVGGLVESVNGEDGHVIITKEDLGVKDSCFYVTYDITDGTADKTYNEITAAIQANQVVVLKVVMAGVEYHLPYSASATIMGYGFIGWVGDKKAIVTVTSSDTWIYNEIEIITEDTSSVLNVVVEDVGRTAQGITMLTLDKTHGEIITAMTQGRVVRMYYNGVSYEYNARGNGGFHHIYMTCPTIMIGTVNTATLIRDDCYIFNTVSQNENKVTYTVVEKSF